MGTVHSLLERLGFVRLRDYGLILTPERRVLTQRARILDDGYGGRVVGWTDGDLAAMELATWGAAPEPMPPPRPLPPKPVLAPPRALPPEPIAVAPPAPPEIEDEWEWEIAAARARAASYDSPPAASSIKPIEDEPTAVRPKAAIERDRTSGQAPVGAIAPREPRLAGGSRTIIPVPSLPTVDPQLLRTYEAPRQFPRATNRHLVAPARAAASPAAVLRAVPTRARR